MAVEGGVASSGVIDTRIRTDRWQVRSSTCHRCSPERRHCTRRRRCVVDDERSILALVQTLLKPCGVDCVVLDDPAEAVALLRRETVDVLVCDAHLRAGPEGDPVQEARRVDC